MSRHAGMQAGAEPSFGICILECINIGILGKYIKRDPIVERRLTVEQLMATDIVSAHVTKRCIHEGSYDLTYA